MFNAPKNLIRSFSSFKQSITTEFLWNDIRSSIISPSFFAFHSLNDNICIRSLTRQKHHTITINITLEYKLNVTPCSCNFQYAHFCNSFLDFCPKLDAAFSRKIVGKTKSFNLHILRVKESRFGF